jgi:hypothetical protein
MKRDYLGFDHVYVINVKRRADKLKLITRALETLGADYTVWEASDFKEMGTGPTFASTDSHIRLLREIESRGYKDALVLEDNVDLDFSAGSVLKLAKQDLPLGWDYMSIYCDHRLPGCEGKAVGPYVFEVAKGGRPTFYSLARALSRSGVQKILKEHTSNSEPQDWLEGKMIEAGKLKAYGMHKPMIVDRIFHTEDHPSDHGVNENRGHLGYQTNLAHSIYEYYKKRGEIMPDKAQSDSMKSNNQM